MTEKYGAGGPTPLGFSHLSLNSQSILRDGGRHEEVTRAKSERANLSYARALIKEPQLAWRRAISNINRGSNSQALWIWPSAATYGMIRAEVLVNLDSPLVVLIVVSNRLASCALRLSAGASVL